jgi:hypothetical protein
MVAINLSRVFVKDREMGYGKLALASSSVYSTQDQKRRQSAPPFPSEVVLCGAELDGTNRVESHPIIERNDLVGLKGS